MSETSTHKIKVWDLPVRLFHWVLVVLFGLSAYSAFQDKFGLYADMHLYSGLGVLVLVVWRVLWGLVGSETARFGQFIKSPAATMRYLGDLTRGKAYTSIGHNPLGALSVCLMLVLLLAQAVMGLYATDAMFFSGPLADSIDGDLAGDLTSVHETVGFVLFGLAGLHLLVIIAYRVKAGVDLVLPMITGFKEMNVDAPAPKMRSALLGLLLLGVVAAGVWWMLLR